MFKSLAALLFGLFCCAPLASADGYKVRATTLMLAEPLAFLFGDQIEVSALMGPGTDPHTYQPTRKDVRSFVEADAAVYHGLVFEAQLLGLMKQLAQRKPVFEAGAFQDGEALIKFQGLYDPHTWHDPKLWTSTLVSIASALADEGELNLDAAQVDLLQGLALEVDAWIELSFSAVPESQRIIVSAHDAFQYFGRRYGVHFEPLQGLSTASETKLARVEELVDLIEERQLSAVFSETTVENAGVSALRAGARSRGLSLRALPPLYSDALGIQGTAGDSYFGMLIENTSNMIDAMTGQRPVVPVDLTERLKAAGLLSKDD